MCFSETGGPVDRITTAAVAAAQRHFERRLEAVRSVIATADGFDAAQAGLLELAARWSPDALARLISTSLEWAALEGREAVFAEIDNDAAFAEPDFTPQQFQDAIEFLLQKRPRPTRAWTDARHGDHDKSFVIAGATDMAMLDEFQTAVGRAVGTVDYKAFAAEFDRIVEKYGWSYNGGREWRIRTIFETNIRTSYMSGRLRQMRSPNVVKVRPYWQYRHADTRVPMNAREAHQSWDDLVLMWDDPWWNTHFPPNDWMCSCGVRTLSARQLQRLGKSGPDKAPDLKLRPHLHKATGERVMLPEGVGFGWDYMPGDQWSRGLVPSALLGPEGQFQTNDPRRSKLVSIDVAPDITRLLEVAVPFKAQVLPDGQPHEVYISALIETLKAASEPSPQGSSDTVVWTDRAGDRVMISADMFFNADGVWKGGKRGHATHAGLIAEAVIDPDEIWLGLREVPDPAFPKSDDKFVQVLTRRYVRIDPASAMVVVLELGRKHWQPITGYAALSRGKPDFGHIDNQRVGKLLWKR